MDTPPYEFVGIFTAGGLDPIDELARGANCAESSAGGIATIRIPPRPLGYLSIGLTLVDSFVGGLCGLASDVVPCMGMRDGIGTDCV